MSGGQPPHEPRLTAPDKFYDAPVRAHEGLSAEHGALINARLVLLLAKSHEAIVTADRS